MATIKMTPHPIALGLGLALACSIVSTRVEASEHVDLEKTVSRDATIRIKNVAGSLRLVGWDKNEITVNGTIGSGVEKVDLSGEPDHAMLQVILHQHSHDGEADLVIKLPKTSRVRFETVSASVDVESFEGPLEGDVVSGSIACDSKVKEATLKTVSGGIRMSGVAERFQLKTVSGSITVTDGHGEANAKTVSGSVEISGGDFTRAAIESVSGTIRFEGSIKGDGSYTFETHSGSITFAIPATTSATFDASTFSGSISSDFGDLGETRHRYGPGREVHFTLGQDGARVALKSFSGNVRIRKGG